MKKEKEANYKGTVQSRVKNGKKKKSFRFRSNISMVTWTNYEKYRVLGAAKPMSFRLLVR